MAVLSVIADLLDLDRISSLGESIYIDPFGRLYTNIVIHGKEYRALLAFDHSDKIILSSDLFTRLQNIGYESDRINVYECSIYNKSKSQYSKVLFPLLPQFLESSQNIQNIPYTLAVSKLKYRSKQFLVAEAFIKQETDPSSIYTGDSGLFFSLKNELSSSFNNQSTELDTNINEKVYGNMDLIIGLGAKNQSCLKENMTSLTYFPNLKLDSVAITLLSCFDKDCSILSFTETKKKDLFVLSRPLTPSKFAKPEPAGILTNMFISSKQILPNYSTDWAMTLSSSQYHITIPGSIHKELLNSLGASTCLDEEYKGWLELPIESSDKIDTITISIMECTSEASQNYAFIKPSSNLIKVAVPNNLHNLEKYSILSSYYEKTNVDRTRIIPSQNNNIIQIPLTILKVKYKKKILLPIISSALTHRPLITITDPFIFGTSVIKALHSKNESIGFVQYGNYPLYGIAMSKSNSALHFLNSDSESAKDIKHNITSVDPSDMTEIINSEMNYIYFLSTLGFILFTFFYYKRYKGIKKHFERNVEPQLSTVNSTIRIAYLEGLNASEVDIRQDQLGALINAIQET